MVFFKYNFIIPTIIYLFFDLFYLPTNCLLMKCQRELEYNGFKSTECGLLNSTCINIVILPNSEETMDSVNLFDTNYSCEQNVFNDESAISLHYCEYLIHNLRKIEIFNIDKWIQSKNNSKSRAIRDDLLKDGFVFSNGVDNLIYLFKNSGKIRMSNKSKPYMQYLVDASYKFNNILYGTRIWCYMYILILAGCQYKNNGYENYLHMSNKLVKNPNILSENEIAKLYFRYLNESVKIINDNGYMMKDGKVIEDLNQLDSIEEWAENNA